MLQNFVCHFIRLVLGGYKLNIPECFMQTNLFKNKYSLIIRTNEHFQYLQMKITPFPIICLSNGFRVICNATLQLRSANWTKILFAIWKCKKGNIETMFVNNRIEYERGHRCAWKRVHLPCRTIYPPTRPSFPSLGYEMPHEIRCIDSFRFRLLFKIV